VLSELYNIFVFVPMSFAKLDGNGNDLLSRTTTSNWSIIWPLFVFVIDSAGPIKAIVLLFK